VQLQIPEVSGTSIKISSASYYMEDAYKNGAFNTFHAKFLPQKLYIHGTGEKSCTFIRSD
jgi:hypothetical protein